MHLFSSLLLTNQADQNGGDSIVSESRLSDQDHQSSPCPSSVTVNRCFSIVDWKRERKNLSVSRVTKFKSIVLSQSGKQVKLLAVTHQVVVSASLHPLVTFSGSNLLPPLSW
ncbi:hypothetical protein BgiMline_029044 [Biomphalaria glabrata]